MRTFSPEDGSLSWEISYISNYFHATCYSREMAVAGSGFAQFRETAKKKAHAELNERLLVRQLLNSTQFKEWGLDFDNSCSGFAVGYFESKSQLRAMAEGIERWTLSRWIDNHYSLPEISITNFSPASVAIQSFFERTSAYLKIVPFQLGNQLLVMNVAVVLGWKDGGVFAGYGSKLSANEAIDHAHIEALRNLVIFRNQPERDVFPYNRIKFFAKNASSAAAVIMQTSEGKWPIPRLHLLKSEKFENLWLSRAIFEDWTPWQFGSKERFLY